MACQVSREPGHVMYFCVTSFYAPLVVMATVYARVFRAMNERSHVKVKSRGPSFAVASSNQSVNVNEIKGTGEYFGFQFQAESGKKSQRSLVKRCQNHLQITTRNVYTVPSNNWPRCYRPPITLDIPAHPGPTATQSQTSTESQLPITSSICNKFSSEISNSRVTSDEKKILSNSRERKAVAILGIIMAVFVGCWLPFFTLYPAQAYFGPDLSGDIYEVTCWLGYCNSALNPIIYAAFNKDFRLAFRRLLTCYKK